MGLSRGLAVAPKFFLVAAVMHFSGCGSSREDPEDTSIGRYGIDTAAAY